MDRLSDKGKDRGDRHGGLVLMAVLCFEARLSVVDEGWVNEIVKEGP